MRCNCDVCGLNFNKPGPTRGLVPNYIVRDEVDYLFVVGEPTQKDFVRKQFLALESAQRKEIDKVITQLGVDPKRCCFAPALQCYRPTGIKTTAREYDSCYPHLLNIIDIARPKRIIYLCRFAWKAHGYTEPAGFWDFTFGIPAILMPSNLNEYVSDPKLFFAFRRTLQKALHGNLIWSPPTDYRVSESVEETIAKLGSVDSCSLDLETAQGLDTYCNVILVSGSYHPSF